ncbi:hypothetical protein [Natrarchaeobaculum aegyptiacum]|uniref:Uncharacterized protein n=1 Tax=Natrarchaeobaculum aegyptiacum TaxID=745377 RepID=A0A2Z2HQ63_9EURY|nr:hypothetical protein [Natrarchaeobaculum aegyptiacum]ARS89062.1 hypothetical protein B1756_04355 [Natrarchaeobaculum aegyptiacum]
MKERQKELLRHESTRRFLGETFVVMVLIGAFLMVVVEPVLLSRFPSIFPEEPVRTGPPRAWVPDTRIGWFTASLGALLLGSYMYYRMYFTDLGKDAVEAFDKNR